jgi:HlyD family secretion protein
LILTLPVCSFAVAAGQLLRGKPDSSLQFHSAQLGAVEVTVTGLGRVEAETVANLSLERPGRILAVNVQSGDWVMAGDVLVQLDSSNEQIAYDRALLSLELAQLRREDLIDTSDDGAIRIAQANLDSAWGAYLGLQNAVSPEDIQAAELRYQQALAVYEDSVQARTHADGGQPDQAYQILDAQVGSASFNAEIARLQLESLQNSNQRQLNVAYARVIQAQRQLDQAKAGPTQAQLDQAEIVIQDAQAQLDQATVSLNQMALVAPFDGVVSAVNAEVGGLATPGLPLVELTDIDPLRLVVQVDEIDIRQISEGMSAHVRLDALPDFRLSGTVNFISPAGTNDTGVVSYDVTVALDETPSKVRAGMTVEASFVVDRRSAVLVVPNEYIRLDRDRNKAYVDVVANDGHLVTDVAVVLGLVGETTSEILSGIGVGDVLAVDLGGDRLSFLGG